MKEDKEKAKVAKEAPKPVPVAQNIPVKDKRELPSYFASAGKSTVPKGKKEDPKAKKSVPSKVPESYKPSYRSKRTKPNTNEEEDAKYQQIKSKPSKPAAIPDKRADKYVGSLPKKSAKPVENKYNNYDELQLNQFSDDIPAELLNKIYSEDMDEYDMNKFQSQEYQEQDRPVSRQPQRLIEDVEMVDDFIPPPRMENRPRNRSPPIRPSAAAPTDLRENENELIQKAIEESLKQYNPRNSDMSKSTQNQILPILLNNHPNLCTCSFKNIKF